MKHLFELIFEDEEDQRGGQEYFENIPYMVEAVAAYMLYEEAR